MKRSLLLLALIIFLIPIAFAESKIYSGSVITDSDLKITEGTFRFTFDSAGNQTFVQTPTINMIIKSGECKSNGVFKVCMGSADYYDRNITTYVTYYKIAADIYKETGSLSTNISASSSPLLQKESTSVKISINNPTDLDVTKINYMQDFYPFTVLNVTGCSLEGTAMKWSGSLQPRYTQACTATFYAPESPGTYNFVGNLSYYNGFNSETISPSALSITVSPKQLQVKESSDSNSEMGQPFYVNLSLSNINPGENLDVSMSIPISYNFNVVKKTAEIAYANGELTYGSRLQPGNIVNLSIYLRPTASGIFSINKKFTYTIKNMRDTIENATYIGVLNPAPIIDLVSEYSELSPGQRFIVSAKLSNPSAIYTLRDIGAKLSVPSFSEVNQNLKQLGPNQSYTIISNSFTLPESYSRDNLKINLNLDYTLNGITKSANKSIELRVKQKFSSANSTSNNVLAVNSINSSVQTQAPAQQIQNTPTQQSPSSSQPPSSPPPVTEEKFSLKNAKLDFSNKNVLIFVGILFILLFIVPIIIFKIKKSKKENTEIVVPPLNPPKNLQ